MSEQHLPQAAGARRLADFIRERREQILAAWEATARLLRPARQLTQPSLLDHMPQFLDELAAFIDGARAGLTVRPPEELPQIHAMERLDEGYDLAEVVAEYGVLRNCLVEIIQHHGSPALRSAEMPRLHQAIDEAISTSVVRFTQARERTMRALDRISTAALAYPDVHQFLDETLRVLLETTAAVDSVSVLLLEEGGLRVRASAGFAAPPGTTLPLGVCIAGKIALGRAPLSARDAEADERVVSEVIQRKGTHALHGVPLLLGDELIGVALMGSRSTFEFSHEDRVLFRTMAARATALVVQGNLREELQRQKDHYGSLLQAQSDLGIGMLVTRGDAIVEVNDAFCRLSGHPRDELLQSSFSQLVAPAGQSGHDELYESVLRRKDGTEADIEVSAKPRPTQEVVLIVRDISERKAAERENEEQRTRLQTLLRVLPVGVCLGEAPSGRLVMGNEAAARIWGALVPSQSVPGDTAYRGFWPDGRPLEQAEWPLSRAVLGGATVQQQEIHIERPDGTRRITEQAAAPIKDAAGRVVAGVVTMVDLTEHKLQEQALRRALSFRDEIMAVLSHDLRTPLMVAMTGAEVLLRGGGLSDKQLKTAERIHTSGERIERMIGDLLDYTRARHSGGLPVAPQRCDLAQLARQSIEGMQQVHPGRTLRLAVEGDTSGRWDPERLLQILSNLLGNALRHGDAGSAVEVLVRGEERHVVLEVTNDGPAIPPETLPQIFEPFRRGDQASRSEGLGLGLYIVRAIAEAHGGEATARSSPGQHTTFSVRLPRELPATTPSTP